MIRELERRSFRSEVRKAAEGRSIEGYAAVFGQLSEDLGGFREMIDPSAFTKTLQEADVRAYWNHNTDYILGRRKAKTLTVSIDDAGLRYAIDPPDTSYARDLIVSMDRGDVDETSFGFRTIRDSWDFNSATDEVIRTLLEVALVEISPCSDAAYPQTTASARSAASEARSKGSAAPVIPDHPAAKQDITGPVIHLADERRMRLEIALRKHQLTN